MQKIFVKNMQFFYRDFSAERADLHEISAGLEWIWFAGNNIYRPVNKCQTHVANGLTYRAIGNHSFNNSGVFFSIHSLKALTSSVVALI